MAHRRTARTTLRNAALGALLGWSASASAYLIPLSTTDGVQNSQLATGLTQIQQMLDMTLRIRSLMEGGLEALGASLFAGLTQLAPPGSQWLANAIEDAGGLGSLSWLELANAAVPGLVEPLGAQMGLDATRLGLFTRGVIHGGIEDSIRNELATQMTSSLEALDLDTRAGEALASAAQSIGIDEALRADATGGVQLARDALAALGIDNATENSIRAALNARLGDIDPREHIARTLEASGHATLIRNATNLANGTVTIDHIIARYAPQRGAAVRAALEHIHHWQSNDGRAAPSASVLRTLGFADSAIGYIEQAGARASNAHTWAEVVEDVARSDRGAAARLRAIARATAEPQRLESEITRRSESESTQSAQALLALAAVVTEDRDVRLRAWLRHAGIDQPALHRLAEQARDTAARSEIVANIAATRARSVEQGLNDASHRLAEGAALRRHLDPGTAAERRGGATGWARARLGNVYDTLPPVLARARAELAAGPAAGAIGNAIGVHHDAAERPLEVERIDARPLDWIAENAPAEIERMLSEATEAMERSVREGWHDPALGVGDGIRREAAARRGLMGTLEPRELAARAGAWGQAQQTLAASGSGLGHTLSQWAQVSRDWHDSVRTGQARHTVSATIAAAGARIDEAAPDAVRTLAEHWPLGGPASWRQRLEDAGETMTEGLAGQLFATQGRLGGTPTAQGEHEQIHARDDAMARALGTAPEQWAVTEAQRRARAYRASTGGCINDADGADLIEPETRHGGGDFKVTPASDERRTRLDVWIIDDTDSRFAGPAGRVKLDDEMIRLGAMRTLALDDEAMRSLIDGAEARKSATHTLSAAQASLTRLEQCTGAACELRIVADTARLRALAGRTRAELALASLRLDEARYRRKLPVIRTQRTPDAGVVPTGP